MLQFQRLLLTAMIVCAGVAYVFPLFAQDAAPSTASTIVASAGETDEELTITDVESDLSSLESSTSIEDAVKDALRAKYKQAIEELKTAEDNKAKAASYRQAIDTAPEETNRLQQELSELPPVKEAAKVDASGTTEELQKELAKRKGVLSALNDEQADVSSELIRMKARPAEISSRIPEAQRELAETEAKLAEPDLSEQAASPGRVAERTLLRAGRLRLLSEIEMLKQAQLSLSAREDLLEAQGELLTRKVENATAVVDELQNLTHLFLSQEAEEVGSVVDMTKQDLSESDVAAQELATEVQTLATEFDAVVKHLSGVATAQSNVSLRLKNLNEEYETLQAQLELDSAGQAMAQVLFDLQEKLLVESMRAAESAGSVPTLDATRLAAIRVEQKIRSHSLVEEQFAGRISGAITRLVATRLEVLKKLRTQYKTLIPALITLEAANEQFQFRESEVRDDVSEQLIWVRSAAPAGVATFRDMPESIFWLFNREHWDAIRNALVARFSITPLTCCIILLTVVALLVLGPRMIETLRQTATPIRRISTDHYGYSAQALVLTVLQASALPLLIGFFAWSFKEAPENSAFLRGLDDGMVAAVWLTFVLALSYQLCRPGGLGIGHFGWDPTPLISIRRTLFWFGVIYIPALLIASSTLYGDASRYSSSIGRISFIVAHLWTSFLFWRLLTGPEGLVATLVRGQPNRLLTRLRYAWYVLLIVSPIAFVVLCWRGYIIAAIELSIGMFGTMGIVIGGEIVYWMALRWFSVKARKLALAERLERIRSLQQSAASEGQSEASELINVDPDEEEKHDLETIGKQTRRLLRSLLSIAVALTIVYLWSRTFPVIPVLSSIEIPLTGGVDLLELGKALLIAGVAGIVVKNLPGVLELSVLRAAEIDAGTGYAISSLCRYAMIAIALVAVCNVLQLDWSKFGWIAAALSVGLGFGLQEVITNFVCGLLLLFERPVRLGDVVTVQGVTGTVTKIRMRATTITNWDRQEFVVPNKNLIIDTILNWTLSASTSRIVITVGAAYGTDTEEARQILIDVANEHPLVMDEPGPSANFEAFADSSLTLVLRCYVPDLDNRLRTITELHTEIDKRFTEAGIEIAFPQQDLHLRTGWGAIEPRTQSSELSR